MKHALAVAIGTVLGLAFITISGFLEVRAIGDESGAVFDLSNRVVAVTERSAPVLPWLALALLGASLIYVMAFSFRKTRNSFRLAAIAGFAIASFALTVHAVVALSGSFDDLERFPGVAEGLRGWLEKGGQSTTVHVVTLFCVGVLLMRPGAHRTGRRNVSDESSPSS